MTWFRLDCWNKIKDIISSIVDNSMSQRASFWLKVTKDTSQELLTTQLKAMAGKRNCPHCSAPVRDVISEGDF